VQVQVLDCRQVVCKFKFSTTDLLCASGLSISDLCASSSSGLQTCCVQVPVLDSRLVVCKKFKFSIADMLCARSSSSRLQTSCVQVQVLNYRLVVCKLALDFRLFVSSSSGLQTCCVQVPVLDCRLVVCKFKFSIADMLCARSSSSRLQTCCVQEVQVLDCRLVVCKKFKFSIADKLRSPDDRCNPVVNENWGFSVTAVALPPISRQPCIDTWTLCFMIIKDASCYNGNQRWKALDLIFYSWSCVYVNKAFFFFFFFFFVYY
jgi:hypothetical protein